MPMASQPAGINGNPASPLGPAQLKVQMGTGAQPSAAHPANHLPLLNLITGLHIQLGEMAIKGALALGLLVIQLNGHSYSPPHSRPPGPAQLKVQMGTGAQPSAAHPPGST